MNHDEETWNLACLQGFKHLFLFFQSYELDERCWSYLEKFRYYLKRSIYENLVEENSLYLKMCVLPRRIQLYRAKFDEITPGNVLRDFLFDKMVYTSAKRKERMNRFWLLAITDCFLFFQVLHKMTIKVVLYGTKSNVRTALW